MIGAGALEAITVDEVIAMAEAGASDEVILAKIRQDGAPPVVSADQVVRLKKAGVSDAVVLALLNGGLRLPAGAGSEAKPAADREAGAPALPSPGGDAALTIRNLAPFAVQVAVRADAREIVLATIADEGLGGRALAPQEAVDLAAPPGEYVLAWRGEKTAHKVRVGADTPAALEIRGLNETDLAIVTVKIADGGSERSALLMSNAVRPAAPESAARPRRGTGLPRDRVLGILPANTAVGAGLGAIVGHQSGHRTMGAVIGGAAGALMDLDESSWEGK